MTLRPIRYRCTEGPQQKSQCRVGSGRHGGAVPGIGGGRGEAGRPGKRLLQTLRQEMGRCENWAFTASFVLSAPGPFGVRIWKFEPFPVYGGCWSTPSLPRHPSSSSSRQRAHPYVVPCFLPKYLPVKPRQVEISVYIFTLRSSQLSLLYDFVWGLRSISGKGENNLIDLGD